MARRFTSIAVKNGLVYILIMLLACIVLSTILFVSSKKTILENSQIQIEHTHDLLLKEFQNYMVDIENDVYFLSNNPFLRKAARSNWDIDILQTLSEEFLAFLKTKEDYNQVRLIGLDNDGKEIIRAERVNGQAKLVLDSDLQSKGKRNYFIEAMNLDEIYFSKIDLNRENGAISQPVMPTLRAAAKIKIDGKAYGLIVINLDLRNFFQKLGGFVGQSQSLYLVSNSHDFVLHPDVEKTFGFEFGKPNMANDFSKLLGVFNNGSAQSEVDNVSYFSRKWPYPRQDYTLACTFEVTNETLLLPVWHWQLENLIYVLLVVFGFGFIAFLMMSRQGHQLEKITSSMVSYGEGKTLGQLPIERNDEIGELSRTLQRMAKSIEDSILDVQKERDKAIKANVAKEEFLENMSHEIRNPLQSTLGMIDVLFQNKPSQEQEKILRSMRFSAQQLKSLVDDILDYSKLKEGIIKLESRQVDLIELLTNICNSYSYEASMNQVLIDLVIDPKLDASLVYLDAVRFTQVMNNLISNAIKFNYPHGRIKIEMQLVFDDVDRQTFLFKVEDTGRGMNSNEINKIGERFYRGDSGISDLDGTGLGLPVVYEILKLFNSKIYFDSLPQKGTKAEFQLSLKKADTNGESSHPVTQNIAPAFSGLRSMLCLDDDPQVRLYFEHAATNSGLDICQIGSKEEWNDILLSNRKFDLIVSDVRLQSLRMTDCIQQLNDRITDHGLLIFISGQPKELGVDAPWLIKPITLNEICNIWLNKWVKYIQNKPVFKSFFIDYDEDDVMVLKALKLLESEWEQTTDKLIRSMQKVDREEYNATYHKLTTTLKRLQLDNLDQALGLLSKELERGFIISEPEIDVFRKCFTDVLIGIRSEIKSRSVD